MKAPFLLAGGSAGPVDVEARIRAAGLWPVVERISAEHSCSAVQLVSRRRFANLAAARRHVWATIRWTLALSYPAIAFLFDVDHTTVMYGVKMYERELEARVA